MTTRARRGQGTTTQAACSPRSGREASLRLVVVTAAIAALSSASLSSCGPPCRGIDTRPLELSCAESSEFLGELHFDSAAPFDTFLRQQCFIVGEDAAADRVLASVDFNTEAVFVARGDRQSAEGRCLEGRALDQAEVCTTGLKLSFVDDEMARETCSSPRWLVAFVLSREDLRAALDAAP